MKNDFTRADRSRRTKIEQLLAILNDKKWHATYELARRVGHTFAVFKSKLVGYGYPIERERHPTRRHQHRYRLRERPKS